MTSQVILAGLSLNDLLERFEQVIDKKISGLHPQNNQQNQTEYITRSEAAKLLKITLPTLHEWSKLGRLQSYKIGSRVLYRLSEVEQSLHKVGSLKFKKGGLIYGA